MATITISIQENGANVGSGWLLVYGDSGTGVRETSNAGTIAFTDVGATHKMSMAFNIVDAAGTLRTGGAGLYLAAGSSYELSA